LLRRFWLPLPLPVLALLLSLFCARPSLIYAQGQDYTGVNEASQIESSPSLFNTEEEAQKHCSQDTIVWLNLSSGVYHFKGQRWYANTNNGAYVCKQEADQAGDRPTENGQ